MKLSHKIYAFGAVLLIFVVLSTLVSSVQEIEILKERITAQLESVVVLKATYLDTFVGLEKDDVQKMASDSRLVEYFQDGLDREKAHALRDMLNEDLVGTHFIEIFILDIDGNVFVSTEKGDEGKIRTGDLYFIEGKEGTYVKSFYYDVKRQQPAMSISTSIKDGDGETKAVLVANINLDKVSDMMTERTGLGETGETYFVNKFNYVVSDLKFEEGAALKKALYTQGVKNCLERRDSLLHSELYESYNNTPVIGAYKWIPDYEVCLFAEVSKDEAFAPLRQMKNTIIISFVALLVMMTVLSYIFSKTILNPIRKLTEACNKISMGDFGVRLDIKTGDELEELAKAFKRMAKSIEILMKTQKRRRKR